MIHPSYVDLMKVVNKDVEEGNEPIISSRYSIVMATAKRARQLIAGDEPMVRVKDREKFLSIAVDELNADKLRILSDEEKAKLKGLPTSLEEALDALEKDHAYLMEGGVFPEELIKNFINIKRKECAELSKIPTPAEFDK